MKKLAARPARFVWAFAFAALSCGRSSEVVEKAPEPAAVPCSEGAPGCYPVHSHRPAAQPAVPKAPPGPQVVAITEVGVIPSSPERERVARGLVEQHQDELLTCFRALPDHGDRGLGAPVPWLEGAIQATFFMESTGLRLNTIHGGATVLHDCVRQAFVGKPMDLGAHLLVIDVWFGRGQMPKPHRDDQGRPNTPAP
jgi:hypothetical protein